AGNSIAQDRRFLRREMPKLDAYLHYRNVDVSTIKELAKRWYPVGPRALEKRQAHQALGDIIESVTELRWYREHYFRPSSDVAAEAPAPAAPGESPAAAAAADSSRALASTDDAATSA